MKTCTACGKSKPLDSFGKRKASKDGLMSACKQCRRAHDKNVYEASERRRAGLAASRKEKYLRNRKFVRKFLEENCCVDCGQSDADLLEFDHVQGTKKYNIAQMVAQGRSISMIQEEMKKCEVRCLYCHRKRTIKQFGWYANLV